ncbi:hypothetical protein PFISCL1PPCAC_21403, partial [Pristionchus fissidentatus]
SVKCTELHPISAGDCLGRPSKTCFEPFISDDSKEGGVSLCSRAEDANDNHFLQYTAKSGVSRNLTDFKCNKRTGFWDAKDVNKKWVESAKGRGFIALHSGEKSAQPREEPFAASAGVVVVIVVVVLIVVGAIIAGVVYFKHMKKKK